MNTRLTVFLFIIWILIFIYLFRKLRTKQADVRFVLPWILLDVLMAVVTAFPGILRFFCRIFGIETPSNMLFFFALVFLGLIVFSMTLTISGQNAQIRDLTQRLAIHEEQEGREKQENGEEQECRKEPENNGGSQGRDRQGDS